MWYFLYFNDFLVDFGYAMLEFILNYIFCRKRTVVFSIIINHIAKFTNSFKSSRKARECLKVSSPFCEICLTNLFVTATEHFICKVLFFR